MKLCQATNADGEPCGMVVGPDEPLCVHHDPARAQEVSARRFRGGVSRQAQAREDRERSYLPISGESAAEVHALLVETLDRCRRGQISVSRARAVAYLGERLLKGIELLHLEREIARLEGELTALRGGR